MNGTVIDIPGISTSIHPIAMEDSTDLSHLITVSDGERKVTISISYGKITQITNEQVRSSKH